MKKRPLQTVHVLCVEDELSIREAIADLLEMGIDSFEVVVIEAANGVEGLAQLRKKTPDLIISDVSMPKMNGFEFLRELRKEVRWARIPFVFLTAHGSMEAERQGRALGIEEFITKPFHPSEFVERIATLLVRAFAERDASAQELQRIQREIAHMLQHEFRTPLTFVMAYFDFLLTSAAEDGPDPDEVHEQLDGILSGDRRLKKLVEDLIGALDVRGGETARQIEQDAVEIRDVPILIQAAIARYELQMANANIKLKVDVPATLPPVFGVETAIQEFVERLLDNAIKLMTYKYKGVKRIWVSAQTTDKETIRLSIRDNGIGFPHHLREQLFDIFYQHDRKQYEQQGPGVGLTLVRGIVEGHGGHIEARGQLGKGAEFVVDLPIYQGDPLVALRPIANKVDRQVTILVVEDEPAVRSNIEILLTVANTPYDYHILTAANGREALTLMQKTVPDLILSDVLMPKLDGFGLLKAVRANQAWLQLPFIFLTAKGATADEAQGRRLGVDDYVTKPYDADFLLNIIETRLRRHFQKKQAEVSEFDALRERVLRSINSSILHSLASIRHSTHAVRSLVGTPDVAAQTAEMRRVVALMKEDTNQLARLIDKIMALTDLRSGVAISSYEKRAQMMEGLDSVVHNARETVLATELYRDSAGNAQIVLAPPPRTAPIRGEKRTLELAIANLFEFNLSYAQNGCVQGAIIDEVEQVALQVTVPKTAVTDAVEQKIEEMFATSDVTTLQIGDSWISLIIAKEYIGMHGGTMTFQRSGGGHLFLVHIPTYDPFADMDF